MRRRALLTSLPAIALVGTAGCTALSRPELEMESGRAVLHPASEIQIANGLQAHGDDRLFVKAVPDTAPDIVGPDVDPEIGDLLRNPGIDQFHIVVQLRSTPDGPIELWPAPGNRFEWVDRSTLRVAVEVQPWGSLDRIDDEAQRQELQTAEELVYTGVWSLSPSLDDLPSRVEMVLASRD